MELMIYPNKYVHDYSSLCTYAKEYGVILKTWLRITSPHELEPSKITKVIKIFSKYYQFELDLQNLENKRDQLSEKIYNSFFKKLKIDSANKYFKLTQLLKDENIEISYGY
jgi:hypothetical protein